MNFLRSVLFLVLVLPITILAPCLILLLLWAPLSWRTTVVRVWRYGFMAVVTYVLGIRYRIKGAENIPPEPVVVLSKHQSAWETVALQDVFAPRWLSFVLKHELLLIPFLGWAFAVLPMIAINRAAGRDALAQVVDKGGRRLREGHSIVIFPEGTRVAPGQKRRYKAGGSHLAIMTGAKVVPVAHNAGEFWPRNAFVKRPGLVTVSIGPVIDCAGLTAEALNAKVEAWIEGEMRIISPQHYDNVASPATTAAVV
jgi:1-acyl-sn-glycerol-3-phosphate acyltransferase